MLVSGAFATGTADEPEWPATVTIGYNRFLESSFGVGAPPIEVI